MVDPEVTARSGQAQLEHTPTWMGPFRLTTFWRNKKILQGGGLLQDKEHPKKWETGLHLLSVTGQGVRRLSTGVDTRHPDTSLRFPGSDLGQEETLAFLLQG